MPFTGHTKQGRTRMRLFILLVAMAAIVEGWNEETLLHATSRTYHNMHQRTESSLNSLSDKTQEATKLVDAFMKCKNIPGMAVSVVVNGTSVYRNAVGKRDELNSVDQHTLFGLGGMTKAFTATALGTLKEKGKLLWTDPVKKHLSNFDMNDHSASMLTTLEDLLLHRTGLPRHDGVFLLGTSSDRKSLLPKMADLEPAAPFRDTFLYNHLQYMVLGEVCAEVSGHDSWETFVKESVLDPCGMLGSFASFDSAIKQNNYAHPHISVGGIVKELSPSVNTVLDVVAAAQGINSNIVDLEKWMKTLLNGGHSGIKQVIQKDTLKEIAAPRQYMSGSKPTYRPAATTDDVANDYGYGWVVGEYNEYLTISHNGNPVGHSGLVLLLPGEHVGISVLCNLGSVPLNGLANQLVDLFVDSTPADAMLACEFPCTYDELSELCMPLSDNDDAHSVPGDELVDRALFTGSFENPVYGTAIVSVEEDDTLSMTLGSAVGKLNPFGLGGTGFLWNTALDSYNITVDVVFSSNINGVFDAVQMFGLEPSLEFVKFIKPNEYIPVGKPYTRASAVQDVMLHPLPNVGKKGVDGDDGGNTGIGTAGITLLVVGSLLFAGMIAVVVFNRFGRHQTPTHSGASHYIAVE